MLTLGRAAAALLRLVASLLLGAVVLGVLGVGALALRLWQGPLDVTRLVHWAAPLANADTSVEHATLALADEGGERVLRVRLTGLRQAAVGGGPEASARDLDASLLVGALLRETVAPVSVRADGVRLRLTRHGDGVTGFGEGDGAPGPGFSVARLATLRVTDVVVEVDDQTVGKPWVLAVPAADASQAPGGTLHGTATATARIGGTGLDAAVEATRESGAIRLHVALSPVSPASLAAVVPALAALDAPVTAVLDAVLTEAGALTHARVQAQAGPGRALLPAKGGGTSPLEFASATLDVAGDAHAATLDGLRLVLVPPSGAPPSTLTLTGDAAVAAGRAKAQLLLQLDRASFADLPALWPPGTGGGGRGWLTENITDGIAHDGRFTFTLDTALDGSDLAVTEAGGSLAAENVTVHWLRPVPPVTRAHVDLVLQGPDVLLLTARDGRQGNIQLRGGTMRITGLSVHDQLGSIALDMAAPLADVLALLKHPKLAILSKRPFPVANPAGAATVHLTVDLPLENKVDLDQVAIHAAAKVTQAHLGGIAGGRDLNNATVALDVTNTGLKADGTGLVDHVPGRFGVTMDFTDGPGSQVLQHVTASLRATERELKASGLDPGGVLTGVTTATLDYAERRDGRATVKLDADLNEAAVATGLGWTKAAGSTGHITAQAELTHGRLTAVDRLRAEAPGLSVEGRSDIAGGQPSVLHIERGIIGRTSATGTIRLPQGATDPYRVTLSGPRLDLSGQASAMKGSGSSKGGEGTPYVVDLRFDRVLVGGARGLGPVSLQADSDGKRVLSAELVSAGPEQVRLQLRPDAGKRVLSATVGDLGTLLREAKLATELNGGTLTAEGAFDDRVPGSPLDGTVDLAHFGVQGAPVIGKILQGMTLYGLVDALRGPGLVFDRMATPFRLSGDVLQVADARAYSSSLGVTAKGQMDFGRGTIALEGTVVPAYFFNSLPGRIPLVGRLFSPERGGGVFATTYSLSGAIKDPSLRLNPLATLTPGALRGLFDVFK